MVLAGTMYLICYDVSNDRIRNKIFKTLEGYGKHTQFSIFECDITAKQLNVLIKQLKLLMQELDDESNIRIYSLCDKCYGKLKIIGEIQEQEDSQTIVV